MSEPEDAARLCWAKIERLLYYKQPGPPEGTCTIIMSIIQQAIIEGSADQSVLQRIAMLESAMCVNIRDLKPAGDGPTCPICNGARLVRINGALEWCLRCAGSGKAG